MDLFLQMAQMLNLKLEEFRMDITEEETLRKYLIST
jgi:hypothetical protein